MAGHPVEKVNGVDVQVLRETVSSVEQDPGLGQCKFRVTNRWVGGTRNETRISSYYAARQEMTHSRPFELDSDEPPMLAGTDEGPNPVEHLLNALAGCVTTSMVAHAAVRGIPIRAVESELEGDLDIRGFFGLSAEAPRGYTSIRISFKVDADPEDLEKLRELCSFSPVLNTITRGAPVEIEIKAKGA